MRSRTYGTSSREVGERHASCDIRLSLLLQLRLLQMLLVLLRTTAAAAATTAAAAAVDCHGFLKVGLLEAACLLYTSPSPRDGLLSRMPSSA